MASVFFHIAGKNGASFCEKKYPALVLWIPLLSPEEVATVVSSLSYGVSFSVSNQSVP